MSRRIKAIVVAAVAVAFVPGLWRLADAGRTNEYAGHAMFVPLFSLLIAWADRDRLRGTAGSGHLAGAAILAAGLALALVGYGWHSDVVQALALAAAAAGAVLWLFGAACLRAAAFPVAFLVMMAPLPRPVVAAVTLELQMFAAGFAAAALRVVGIPVYHWGAHLELATMTLQVAEICNGLRFLLAILVLTAAFGQITLPSWRRKVALVVAAIPIAIVANALRVAAIAIGVHYIGPDAASGTVHNWIGKGVWALTLLPLISLGVVLARFRRSPRPGSDVFAPVAASKTGVA
jgi:exosortase